jgi:hypothetical protein
MRAMPVADPSLASLWWRKALTGKHRLVRSYGSPLQFVLNDWNP